MSLSPLGLLSARDASQQRSRHRSFFWERASRGRTSCRQPSCFPNEEYGIWTRDLRSLLANVHDRPFTDAEVPALLAYLRKI